LSFADKKHLEERKRGGRRDRKRAIEILIDECDNNWL